MFSIKIVYARVEASPSGGIQQLRGQEEGEGGQKKVHACPRRC